MAFSSPLTGLCQPEVERQLGYALSPEQSTELTRLVVERSRKLRVEPSTYIQDLNAGEREDEALVLAGHFTIGESYFFRDRAQLNLCCELIVKQLRDQTLRRPIKVLSAGCSTGEEPYSLIMLLREQMGSTEWLEVSAIDINRSALDKARKGRYSTWSLRETPDSTRDRWFRSDGRDYQLSPEITQHVTFGCASLNTPSQAVARSTYDVILCRNVLMYFTAEKYHAAALRLIDALVPSGHLLLGHAESLRGLGLPVDLVNLSDSFCYRKSVQRLVGNSDPLTNLLQTSPVTPAYTAAPPLADSEKPDEARRGEAAPISVTLQSTSASPLVCELAALTSIKPLLESERFVEALQTLEASPQTNSPVKQLCLAVLLVYANRFDAAVTKASALLNVESVAAEAHYALALCHEYSGDWAQATDLARRATYLDPTFAMPWLHLGILSRKRGDNLAARRELLQARALLTVEPPERLLWFGGGCSRSTLLAACQRELAWTGGAT
jgi:chemotaxis protein methyltransferase CheR